MKLPLVLLSAAALLGGCAIQRYDLNPAASADTPQHDEAQTFWVGGIGQTQTVDANQTCGGAHKVARVETEQTAGNVVLNTITLGIYSPRQVRVYCKR